MNQLREIAPGWPEPPGPEAFPFETPLPRDQWPPLRLTWWDITPTVLESDRLRGDVTDSLLHAEGAPAPVAYVSKSPQRFGGGWLWRCGVYVLKEYRDRGKATLMGHDCRRFGGADTRAEARQAARRHVRERHPDAAVPYTDRRLRALDRWF
ncbi:MAG TPA: hypothetical protein VK545_08165 [Streptomyces sp.]|nr:hypothetical protein [Streptomyces sp.]